MQARGGLVGEARRGAAMQARHGRVGSGTGRHGQARQARQGTAGHGAARRGIAG